MCLIVLDWQPGQSLSLSANRDEFFKRPSAPLCNWSDHPSVIAGRDLEQGGTWLGINKQGQWAALTNVRAPGIGPLEPRSRGHIVSDYLQQSLDPLSYAQTLLASAEQYAPFNLLVGDWQQLYYLSNYPDRRLEAVAPGIHALSNAQLDSPWPKAQLAQAQLQKWLKQPDSARSLANLLNRRHPFADNELPDTGVGLVWERLLSAQRILAPGYGTRCSTGLILRAAQAEISEISWSEDGQASSSNTLTVHFDAP